MQGGNEATDLDIAMLLGELLQLTRVIYHKDKGEKTPFEHQYHP